MQRYFSNIKIEDKLILKDEDLYHIKKVMRMKDNDEIIVVYQNTPYLCCLENVNHNIEILIKEQLEKFDDKMLDVTLIIPLLKEQKIDYILQKSTELGVKKIIPYSAERSIIKINSNDFNKKIERWKRIVKEASEQCHRNDIPIIDNLKKISDLNDLDGISILCSTKEKEKNIKNVLKTCKEYDKINIVAGPEGGLSDKEEEKFKEIGFIPVSLGPRIMRAETVPLFIMSIINYEFME